MKPKIRSEPEDFDVEEVQLFSLDGEGQHTYLLIEKRRRTTDEIWKDLARELGLQPRDVGYAGRKDRHAVTRQWFSIPAAHEPGLESLPDLDGWRILERVRHRDRLRVGQLAGNKFRLTVRDVGPEDMREAEARLEQIRNSGVQNRYGKQRFGRDGHNADRGLEILRQDRLRGDRRRAWLMVSALQSAVFNRVLERRPVPVWELMPGDLAWNHRSETLLQVQDPTLLAEPLAAFQVSPTGPIFGTKMRRPSAEVAVLEAEVMEELGIGPLRSLRLPRGLRLFGERRPLRIPVADLEWDSGPDQTLALRFQLPAGSYATVLLDEIFPGGFEEAAMPLGAETP